MRLHKTRDARHGPRPGWFWTFPLWWLLANTIHNQHWNNQVVHAWKFRFPGRGKSVPRDGTDASKRASQSPTSSSNPQTPSQKTATVLPTTPNTFTSPVLLAEQGPQVVQELTDLVQGISRNVQQSTTSGSLFLPAAVVTSWERLQAILFYKPPVGIVSVVAIIRLVFSGRLFRLYPAPPKNSVEEALQQETRKRERERHRGRSLNLDADDVAYHHFGGVDRVRRRLCWAGLGHLLEEVTLSINRGNRNDSTYTEPETDLDPAVLELLQAMVAALSVSNHPGGARAQFVHDMIQPFAKIEELLIQQKLGKIKLPTSGNVTTEAMNQIVGTASWTAEVRILDALLRVCRDRLLKTTYRLARTREHWERKVEHIPKRRLLFGWKRKSAEGDRLRLSYAKAAYQAEIQRLGAVAAILLERPDDMGESYLLEALKQSENARALEREEQTAHQASLRRSRLTALTNVTKWQLPKLEDISRYSIRWRAEGVGSLQIRRLDGDTQVHGESALHVLTQDISRDSWMNDARAWSTQARRVLCNVVRESLQGSVATGNLDEVDFAVLEQQWCTQKYHPNVDVPLQWIKILRYVDNMPSWRRVGEGKVVRLKDAALVHWTKRLDLLGIPSTMAWIAASQYVHEKIRPYFPTLKRDMMHVFDKTVEILQTRVWVPVKGIYDDIMNKNQGIFSAFGLEVEQTSLDHMLRDMGLGDGTVASRQEALKRAAEKYEETLKSGVIISALQGKLVRLLLVQVQQLKVGLLTALDTIDVLLKGNRIHFQILAAIPAVVMATYGTRLFLRALYNIRSRDLRPVTAVHAEMGEYLNQMERMMLLSSQEGDGMDQRDRTKAEPSKPGNARNRTRTGTPTTTSGANPRRPEDNPTSLSTGELGEFVLHMHRYLILLDFSSPPFPNWACDQIQEALQMFLGTGGTLARGMGPSRHVAWLNLVQKKHEELLKHM